MRINSFIKQIIPQAIITRLRQQLGVPSQIKSFENLRKLGFAPKIVLDIGAYEGFWALDFQKIFPEAAILMIEGQKSKEEILKQRCLNNGLHYKIALLGATERRVDFNIYDTASSVLEENNYTGALIEQRNLRCLDKLLEDTEFNKPDFIKLDTQGYELEILKGGEIVLDHSQAVLMEVSMIDIYKEAPLVCEALNFMKERNFLLYDICSLMTRPLDGSLYQSDFLFVKQDSFLRKSKRWI